MGGVLNVSNRIHCCIDDSSFTDEYDNDSECNDNEKEVEIKALEVSSKYLEKCESFLTKMNENC